MKIMVLLQNPDGREYETEVTQGLSDVIRRWGIVILRMYRSV